MCKSDSFTSSQRILKYHGLPVVRSTPVNEFNVEGSWMWNESQGSRESEDITSSILTHIKEHVVAKIALRSRCGYTLSVVMSIPTLRLTTNLWSLATPTCPKIGLIEKPRRRASAIFIPDASLIENVQRKNAFPVRKMQQADFVSTTQPILKSVFLQIFFIP